jgi:hypothetical protein
LVRLFAKNLRHLRNLRMIVPFILAIIRAFYLTQHRPDCAKVRGTHSSFVLAIN